MANPLQNTFPTPPPAISTTTHPIAGILTTIQGLSELPPSHDISTLSIIWLLHPRNGSHADMLPYGASLIHAWNAHRPSSSAPKTGLIAVSFDQRNHGTRLVNELANEAWRQGNKRHAQDMFGTYHGTASDVQVLMEHLGNYLFEGRGVEGVDGKPVKERHFVLGISLGGHAAWQLWFNEPRIEGAISIIGCPDYMRVMSDRARLSKLKTWHSSNGSTFLGSTDFPPALVAACEKYDPRGQLFGTSEIQINPSTTEQARLRKLLDPRVKGRSILFCSGGIDKLVPYRCSEPFLKFLKSATGKGGWYADRGVYVEDNVYEGVGHATSPEMVRDSVRFLVDLLEGKDLTTHSKSSKM